MFGHGRVCESGMDPLTMKIGRPLIALALQLGPPRRHEPGGSMARHLFMAAAAYEPTDAFVYAASLNQVEVVHKW